MSKPIPEELSDSLLDFLSALWARALNIAGNDPKKAEAVHENVLKLHGFPVGSIWPEAVVNAIRMNNGPKNSETPTDVHTETEPAEPPAACPRKRERNRVLDALLRDALNGDNPQGNIANVRRFVKRFVSLSEKGKLEAISGPLGARPNPGTYQGRIAQIDPTRWNDHQTPQRQHDNHNMTNITWPSVSDAVVPVWDTEDQEEEKKSYSDPIVGERILIPMTVESSAPERIRFSMEDDGIIHFEPVEAKGASAWWRGLSPARKRAYLERHPNSKYAKAYRLKLAQKKAQARKAAGKGKNAPKIVKDLDQRAAETVDIEEITELHMSPEEDVQLDELLNDLDEVDLDQNTEKSEDQSEDDPKEPALDPKAGEQLGEAVKKPGFLKKLSNTIKQRVSSSTLGAMGRFVQGKMREDDKQKVVKAMVVATGALAVIGAGVGVAMLGGPSSLVAFASLYVDHMSDGGGFDFGTSESSDESKKDDTPISDEQLEKLTKHFVDWLVEQSKITKETVINE